MTWTHRLLPLAAALPLACLADDGTAARSVALKAKTPGEFEVVYHRVSANMTGAAFFGLVGAAVQGGSQSGQDGELTRKVLPKLTEPACGQPLVDAMAAKLREAGFTVDAGAKGPLVVVVVKECSLRMVDTAQQHVASYVNVALDYHPAGARAPEWSETIQITGKNRRAFDDFVNEAGLAQAELSDALARAGSRAANKLIYRDNREKP